MVALLCELGNGIAAIEQDALVAIDVGDLDSQLAVDVNPGSYVNIPVLAYNFPISTTDGPIEPVLIGISTLLSPRLKVPVVAFMGPAFDKISMDRTRKNFQPPVVWLGNLERKCFIVLPRPVTRCEACVQELRSTAATSTATRRAVTLSRHCLIIRTRCLCSLRLVSSCRAALSIAHASGSSLTKMQKYVPCPITRHSLRPDYSLFRFRLAKQKPIQTRSLMSRALVRLIAQAPEALRAPEHVEDIEYAGRVARPVSAARRGCATWPSFMPSLFGVVAHDRFRTGRGPISSSTKRGSNLAI